MRWVLLLLALAVSSGCSKTEKKCAEYARLEMHCEEEPDDESREAAKASCMDAHKKEPADPSMAEEIKARATCAVKNSDCKSYLACKRRLEP
jgi:hypothetical protein